MKIKLILSAMLLVLLGVSVLWAGDPWKEKPYTEWTKEDVQKVFEKSPWVRSVRVRTAGKGSSPMEPGPVKEDLFLVRWSSSLTVREALMRSRQLRGASTKGKVKDILSVQPDHYAIVVSSNAFSYYVEDEDIVIVGAISLDPELKEPTREAAYLEPENAKQRITPFTVEFSGRDVVFFFPREMDGQPVIGPDERKVKFFCKFEDYEVKTSFDLRKMVRDGKPDL